MNRPETIITLGSVGCDFRMAGAAAPFDFPRDTFAFANETKWSYRVDPSSGRQVIMTRSPAPGYVLRCFPLVRAARQFARYARFDPVRPVPGDAECRRLVRRVLSRRSGAETPPSEPVVIPGFAGLRQFSAAHGAILKSECGSAWQSYLQRGNWRMVFPFLRRHQEREAGKLLDRLGGGGLPIVHLVRFPQLTINHGLLLFRGGRTAAGMEFQAYDPNLPAGAVTLSYDDDSRTFRLPPVPYFAGGRVDVYEIYQGWMY